ncbi:hypothetical protein AB0A12_31905 [Streptomyces virginiae]
MRAIETGAPVDADGATVDGVTAVVDAVALDEAVGFTSDLIRIDTTNRGGGDCRERPAAEYVAERLAAAGLERRPPRHGRRRPPPPRHRQN